MKKSTIGIVVGIWAVSSGVTAHILKSKAEKKTNSAVLMEPIEQRHQSVYEKYVKRGLDVLCASAAITAFAPLYLTVAGLVRLKLGSPVLFTQDRPGIIGSDGKEKIFKMYKFRSMTDDRDENGELLPDEQRLPAFGKMLRTTSLDELPEAFNILRGDMSVIGPRPQLVRDMVFMTNEQRMRHTAKPGLSGLAQVNGRNAVSWEQKFDWDIKYIEKVSFLNDLKLVMKTALKVFSKSESSEELDVTLDFGDALLKDGKVSQKMYDVLQAKARITLNNQLD